jgi:hypothetical protein
MNRKYFIVVLVVLLVGVLVGLWKWPRPQSKPTELAHDGKSQQPLTAASPTKPDGTPPPTIVIPDIPGANIPPEDEEKLAKIGAVYRAPVDFLGKVIDQHGHPVVGAKVKYSLVREYFRDATVVDGGISDEHGLFSRTGMSGASVLVSVFRERYYGTDRSARSFGYGMPSGEAPPTKENPAIFVLHKMGETEPLIFAQGSVRLPRDGTLTEISLRRERPAAVAIGNGDLRIEVWTDDANKDALRQYDWRCRITVPGGGLVERTGAFDFSAPLDGYTATFEHAMLRGGSRWTNNLQKEFFLKLADGSFARVSLQLAAGGDHFVYLESYLNPTPGSRNLEFDPAKAITPKP